MSRKTIEVTDRLYDYMLTTWLRDDPLMARLRAETAEVMGDKAGMQIAPDQGQFMAFLVEAIGARRILEVGTFTGYSALSMARALPADGELVCCDVSEEYTAIAQRYWQEAGVAGRITLKLAPAMDTLDQLIAEGAGGSFDMAFIDADKPNYPGYVERSFELVRTGGVILIDNTLWNGAVADPERSDEITSALRSLNARLREDERFSLALAPIGDGVTLLRKR